MGASLDHGPTDRHDMTIAHGLQVAPGGKNLPFLRIAIESAPNGIDGEVRQYLLELASNRLFNHRARVLMALLAYAQYQRADDAGESRSGSQWLVSSLAGSAVASYTGLDTSNVFRALRALVQKGCITRLTPGAGKGDNVGRAAVYRIC